MLLGIDTSGAVSTAVARGALPGPAAAGTTAPGAPLEILQVRSDERSRHHDEVLLALIDETLHAAGVERGALTGVVVGRGPGPFTGLRVGLVSARSIAAVLGIPLHGLSSLDARRREVYHARYRREAGGEISRVADPAVAAPAEVAEELTACDLLVGSGTRLYPELLPATADLVHVDAGHLLLAAAALTARGEDLTSTEPLYLREPDAAKPTARKSALGR